MDRELPLDGGCLGVGGVGHDGQGTEWGWEAWGMMVRGTC